MNPARRVSYAISTVEKWLKEPLPRGFTITAIAVPAKMHARLRKRYPGVPLHDAITPMVAAAHPDGSWNVRTIIGGG